MAKIFNSSHASLGCAKFLTPLAKTDKFLNTSHASFTKFGMGELLNTFKACFSDLEWAKFLTPHASFPDLGWANLKNFLMFCSQI